MGNVQHAEIAHVTNKARQTLIHPDMLAHVSPENANSSDSEKEKQEYSGCVSRAVC